MEKILFSYRPHEAGSNPPTCVPLYISSVAAGFPSPADDYIERRLDLNELLIKHPAATFFVRAQGDSMLGAGIQSGDILVVDRSETPIEGSIIIAVLDGELTVKRLHRTRDGIELRADNPDYAAITVTPEQQFEVWGIVTSVIHQVE